ncbi:hypothetical protein [Hymenobacter arizonensis]|uniref:Uncharacterized protein n=1 Tax=Hymenobacter arizonensis TaxID=1227077 RepID=A0A1I6B4Q3_HYMAR|nr:hypothetical protein [Hymenobacter arizonensis]SFQ75911.1 hypothetical protein SAMN04515668_4162 [Hymenobacter arizonensis]
MAIRLTLVLFLLLAGLPGSAQLWQPVKPLPADYLLWSPTRRLKASDFEMKLRPQNNLNQSLASFGLQMNGSNMDLLSKQANHMVQNYFHRSGSYIDSTDSAEVARHLLYMQTQWDIYEVSARRLRQQLRASAKKIILVGKPDVNDLFRAAHEEGNRRTVQYADETKYGLFLDKQQEWERQLAAELAELAAFATAF